MLCNHQAYRVEPIDNPFSGKRVTHVSGPLCQDSCRVNAFSLWLRELKNDQAVFCCVQAQDDPSTYRQAGR